VLRVVEGGRAQQHVTVPSSAAAKLPAWNALFTLLDTVARQASGGAIATGDANAAPLVEPID
jgi:hypothetical protein